MSNVVKYKWECHHCGNTVVSNFDGVPFDACESCGKDWWTCKPCIKDNSNNGVQQ